MGWEVNAKPQPLYPWERPPNPSIFGWVGLRKGLDGCGIFRPPPGFDPPTVQLVPSRYTDRAIPTHRSVDRGYTELTKDKNKIGHFSASNCSAVKLCITGISKMWFVSFSQVVRGTQRNSLLIALSHLCR